MAKPVITEEMVMQYIREHPGVANKVVDETARPRMEELKSSIKTNMDEIKTMKSELKDICKRLNEPYPFTKNKKK
jgi:hypothetical protein